MSHKKFSSRLWMPLLGILAFAVAACDSDGGGSDNESGSFTEISAEAAYQLLMDEENLVIIDVSDAWAEGHLPGALSYPVGDGTLDYAIPSLDPSLPYLVYCHADAPAIEGAQKLIDAGFTTVYRLLGNYGAWVDAGYDVELPPAEIMEISAADAYQLTMDEEDLVIIDVSPAWDQGHLPGALSYPVGDGSLDDAISMLDPSLPYLVYCHADAPAIEGAQKLIDAGFSTVYRLLGNYGAWVDAGYDVELPPAEIMEISAADAYDLMMGDPDLVIIDVSPYYDAGHLPGAMSYPVGDGSLDYAIPSLDPSLPYLVYCHADGPAIQGAQKLIDAGFTTVYRLLGNYSGWIAAGYDVETGGSGTM